MKVILMIGSTVVTLALIFYSLGFSREIKGRQVTRRVLFFYTMGVILDITATIMMIIGSSHGMLTGHGFIGYSSLLGMIIDTSLLWRHNIKQGSEKVVGSGLQLYSSIAYSWWVIAYVTGAVLVAIRKIYG